MLCIFWRREGVEGKGWGERGYVWKLIFRKTGK